MIPRVYGQPRCSLAGLRIGQDSSRPSLWKVSIYPSIKLRVDWRTDEHVYAVCQSKDLFVRTISMPYEA